MIYFEVFSTKAKDASDSLCAKFKHNDFKSLILFLSIGAFVATMEEKSQDNFAKIAAKVWTLSCSANFLIIILLSMHLV